MCVVFTFVQHIWSTFKKKMCSFHVSGKSQGNLAYCQGNLECFVNARELLGNFENTIFYGVPFYYKIPIF